jgi:hypothetical protein
MGCDIAIGENLVRCYKMSNDSPVGSNIHCLVGSPRNSFVGDLANLPDEVLSQLRLLYLEDLPEHISKPANYKTN